MSVKAEVGRLRPGNGGRKQVKQGGIRSLVSGSVTGV